MRARAKGADRSSVTSVIEWVWGRVVVVVVEDGGWRVRKSGGVLIKGHFPPIGCGGGWGTTSDDT